MSSMPLAPVDYVFTGPTSCPITFAFAYKQRLEPKRLQQGLSLLVERMPWLAGQLRATSDTDYAFEVSDQPRLALEVGGSHKTFSELSVSETVRVVRAFPDERLAWARLTQLPSGSVLSVSISHALVDGFSFFQALSAWAACTRGQSITAPPMQRLLQPTPEHVRAASEDLSARALFEATGMFWAQPRKVLASPVQQQTVAVSAAELDQLVADAQRDVAVKLRQNDVITAWLWRTYGTKWSQAQADGDLYMSCPVDVRRQLAEANAAAFGCTITNASVRVTLQELSQLPLGELALRIQQAVAEVFADDWKRRVAPLEALRMQHGLSAMHSVHMRHPHRGMLVTNLSRLPLAELDFGFGAPHDFKSLGQVDSSVSVLPAKTGLRLGLFAPASLSQSAQAYSTERASAWPSAGRS